MPAAQAQATVTRTCVGQISAHMPVLLSEWTPEALHQIRVALRRWRSAQTVFQDLGGGGALADDLKWLAGELDEARDLDVFEQTGLPAGRKGGPHDLSALTEALEMVRNEAHARAVRALQSDRCQRLLWDSTRGAEADPDPSATPPLSAYDCAKAALDHQWRVLLHRGRRLGKLGPSARHRLRIAAKKLRYTAELFGPLFEHPRRQRRLVAALRKLQGVLGDMNDIHVGRALSERLAMLAGEPQAAFTAGLLAGERLRREDRLLARSATAYRALCEVKPFW